MVWYSHLFKNFPQIVVIHTVKGFSIVNEAEVEVFLWNSLAFFYDPMDIGNITVNITVIQVKTQTTNAEEAEVEWFYEDLQDLLELIPKKEMSISL